MAWALGDYVTVEDFRREIRTSETSDDVLIEELIRQASREIDQFCGRHFYGLVQTRYFDALHNVDGISLLLDEDLAGVISITLGDGTTVAPTEYVMRPLNTTPKVSIKLLASSAKWWTYTVDPEAAIAIDGTWGYVAGTVPPEPIRRAALMLSRYRYERFQAPFETQGQGDLNAMSTPSAIPEDIKQMLMLYMKPQVWSVERY